MIHRTGYAGSTYNYNSSFAGIDESSSIQVNGVPPGTWAAETLEAYGITNSHSEYPHSTVDFTNITVDQNGFEMPPLWKCVQAVAGSNQQAVIVSNANPGGEIDISMK